MRFTRPALLSLAASFAIVSPTLMAQSVDFDPFGPIPTSNLGAISNGGFGSATTQRTPPAPREDETILIYFRVCCQNAYDRVAIYYTTDGSEPQGSASVGFGTTQVISNVSPTGPVQFIANQFGVSGGTRDWWRATLPVGTRAYNQRIRYKLARWINSNPNATQAWAGGGSSSNAAQTFEHTNLLAWPGQGSAFPGNEGVGYPPFWPYKEEGVVGNNFINSMLDQNGNIFDIYYPGAGAVQGIATKNEGYVDGFDTFPAGLPLDNRGQMHLNQILTGIRAGGITSWLSNQNGTDFTNIQQQYEPRTQTITTTSTYVRAGRNISITQHDFSPKGVFTPPNASQGMTIKRMILRNNQATTQTVNVYMYMDPALNGGDNHDFMLKSTDMLGAMIAGDNTYRVVTNTGSIGFGQEYNPTTFGGYEKNVSVFLAAAMKTVPSVNGTGGAMASDAWRDTSGDNGQGWIGQQVILPPNQDVEVNFIIVGGFERPAGRDAFAGINGPGVYNIQMGPIISWFRDGNTSTWQAQTDAYWQNFLNQGVTVELPDARLQTLFDRGILGTMLHFDERTGGLIAGFRNGAYPFVWPRDMAWAGVTLARVGHTDVVDRMTRFLRDTTFRDFETWTNGNTPGFEAAGGNPFFGTRKGFWKQKYTTDGFTVWGAPQVDETAVIPWMVLYNYKVHGDANYLIEDQAGNPANTTYSVVKDAAIAMSQTSKNDGTRLNHRQSYPGASTFMMYSNNVWEDKYDTFIMSNANIVRGLRDAATIAGTIGQPADANDFINRANGIKAGLDDKLFWNGEASDISMLGIVYPFETHLATDTRAVKIIDRINGVAQDRFGNTHPLVRFPNQFINNASDFVGLIDRYWGDSYWGNGSLGNTPAGPWFLTTLWYGAYYAMRQDFTPGKADIDNHLYRLNRAADHNGPIGFGAEQMAPSNSLLYPGQSDFTLQTAWPNAWESMSFYVDSVMLFLDFTPDSPGNTLRTEPKLPTGWTSMKFNNLPVRDHRIDMKIEERFNGTAAIFTNRNGGALNFNTVLRIPAGTPPCYITLNGQPASADAIDTATGRVTGSGPIQTGIGAETVFFVFTKSPTDIADDSGNPLPPYNVGPNSENNGVTEGDYNAFFSGYFEALPYCDIADDSGGTPPIGTNNGVTEADYNVFFSVYFNGCPS